MAEQEQKSEVVELFDARAEMERQRARAETAITALREVGEKQEQAVPAGYEYANANLEQVKRDRDELRQLRQCTQGRIAAALGEPAPAPGCSSYQG
jgi:vacuolar-type H+-ATPase subunit E/Vma4